MCLTVEGVFVMNDRLFGGAKLHNYVNLSVITETCAFIVLSRMKNIAVYQNICTAHFNTVTQTITKRSAANTAVREGKG